MTRANPPPQKLPDDLEDDLRDVRGLFTYLEDTQFQQYQMWKRSGAGDDFFDSIDARLDAVELRLDAVELRLDLVEARTTYLEGLIVVTAIDHTVDNEVTGNQTIICNAGLTVDLALAPNDKDKVTVISNGNEIDISGNGKLINGETVVTLRTGFLIGLDMIYSSADDGWFEV